MPKKKMLKTRLTKTGKSPKSTSMIGITPQRAMERKESLKSELRELLERGDMPQYYNLLRAFPEMTKGRAHTGRAGNRQKRYTMDSQLEQWTTGLEEHRSEKYVGQKLNEKAKKRRLERIGNVTEAVINGKIYREPLGSGSVFVVRGMKGLYNRDAMVIKFRERGVERAKRLEDISFDAGVEMAAKEAKKGIQAHRMFEKAAGKENVAEFYAAQMMLPKESIRKGQKVVMAPREVYVFQRVKPLIREEYSWRGGWQLKDSKFPDAMKIRKYLPKILRLNKRVSDHGLMVDSSLRNYGLKFGSNKVVFIDTLHTQKTNDSFFRSTINMLSQMKMIYKKDYPRLREFMHKEIEAMIAEENDKKARQELERQFKMIRKY